MPGGLNLKLDVSDVTTRDTLRGPGSSSTEQIPSTSPLLHSPFASSIDPYRHLDHADEAIGIEVLKDEKWYTQSERREKEEQGLHIVIVGGDAGAFVTALALAKSVNVQVTLVNAGLGPLSILGSENATRGSQLIAHILERLDELGRWEGSDHYSPQEDSPFDLESRSSRWKGKGLERDVVDISDRIREEGSCFRSFQLRRYSTGEVLTSQEFAVSTGEDVSMVGVDTDAFLTILRDTCLSHPRIIIRPRGIVRSVLSGSPTPLSAERSTPQKDPGGDGKPISSSIRATDSSGYSELPKRDRERRRKVRESFIQLDDDENDYLSLLSGASARASTDTSLNEFLRSLPSRSSGPNPFSTEDLPSDAPPPASNLELETDLKLCRPAVILTSGERIEADAVIGTEGTESKVLDAIRSVDDGTRGGRIVREDGLFRATVSVSKLLQDPDLRGLVSKKVTWVGSGRFLAVYPLNFSSVYVQLIVEGRWVRNNVTHEDEATVTAQQMKDEVHDWCLAARKLVALIGSATYEPLVDYDHSEEWVSDSGRVLALGDAAHSLLQSFHHLALGTTINDGLTLGALLSKLLVEASSNAQSDFSLRSLRLIPRLLNAFATLRRPHYLREQLTLREGRDLFLLQDGEQQRRRDQMLKEDGLLNAEDMRREWLFNPVEEVERWWASEMKTGY